MGYCITVYTDELDSLNRVLGSRDPELLSGLPAQDPDVLLSSEDGWESERTTALRKLVEVGLDGNYSRPGATIQALMVLCEKHCTSVGELDNFRYDEDDFPELWDFQFKDSSTDLQLPVDLDHGIPAVNHWPTKDIRQLQERMRKVDLASRKEYTHAAFGALKSWLDKAADESKGLFVFYE
jgi:hypothetical protein